VSFAFGLRVVTVLDSSSTLRPPADRPARAAGLTNPLQRLPLFQTMDGPAEWRNPFIVSCRQPALQARLV
jgi:hypothetical protein